MIKPRVSNYSQVYFICILLVLCFMSPSFSDSFSNLMPEFGCENLPPLSFTESMGSENKWEEYYRFYGFELPERMVCHAGWVVSGSYKIAVQVFTPADAAASVFLVHGYYDHTGLLAPLVNFLLQKNYSVVSVDLPGQGLSGGARASIEDFADYGNAIKSVMDAVKPYVPQPLFFIGHSTGSAALLEYLYDQGRGVEPAAFEKIVLLAPLVRIVPWQLSKFGLFMGQGFLEQTKRWYRQSSSDNEFLQFQKEDPLRYDLFPVLWSKALFAWEKRFQHYPEEIFPVMIIQGTKDKVVDFKYNVPFLQKKISAKVEYVEGAGHQLVNEIPEYRIRVFGLIDAFFQSGQ